MNNHAFSYQTSIMEQLTIQIQEGDRKGMAFIGDPGQPRAAMTFTKAGNELMIIDHTEVEDALRGQQVGRKLLDALVNIAREKGIKVLPLCPYARSVFQKEESIRDVLRK